MQFARVRRAALTAGATLCVLHFSACSSNENPTPGTSGSGTVTATSTLTTSTGVTAASATTGGTATVTSTTGGTTSSVTGSVGTTATSSSGTSQATATTGGTASTSSTGSVSTSGAGGTTGTTSTTTGGASTAVLSDDFESVAAGSPPDPARWQLRVPATESSIAITTEQAHTGTQSVKVVGTNGATMFFTQNVFPLPAGVLYLRVWMRFTNANWANHNAFIAAGPGEESQEVRFGGQNNAYHSNLPADSDALSPDPYESPSCPRCVAPVADEWKCLRGKLDFANNVAELYVGDALAVDSATDGWHNNATGVFPLNPSQIGFGWAMYGAPENTVYYDDLALGYEPIACE